MGQQLDIGRRRMMIADLEVLTFSLPDCWLDAQKDVLHDWGWMSSGDVLSREVLVRPNWLSRFNINKRAELFLDKLLTRRGEFFIKFAQGALTKDDVWLRVGKSTYRVA